MRRRAQFISEFLIESVEFLERIANEKEPPMQLSEIEAKREEMYDEDPEKQKEVRAEFKEMEKAFCGRGNLENWSAEVLEKIDECFVNRYKDGDMPISTLFFPGNENDSYDVFLQYCGDVDQVLRLNGSGAPKYAREYFAYYCVWQMRGFSFPVPLGTASVVEVLHDMARLVPLGFSEVRCRSITTFGWWVVFRARVGSYERGGISVVISSALVLDRTSAEDIDH